jgi:hypothetical protein
LTETYCFGDIDGGDGGDANDKSNGNRLESSALL